MLGGLACLQRASSRVQASSISRINGFGQKKELV